MQVKVKIIILLGCLSSVLNVSWSQTAGQRNQNPSPDASNTVDSSKLSPVSSSAPPLNNFKVDQSCFRCLCLASTGCKSTGCHLAGPNQYYCGPYLISWAYWADAGKPGDSPANPYAFEECLNNTKCSEATIQGYVNKHGRDCNADSQINCADVARIHKSGPTGCEAPWIDNTTYWQAFTACNSDKPLLDVRGNFPTKKP